MFKINLRIMDAVAFGSLSREVYFHKTIELGFVPHIGMDICFFKDNYFLKVAGVDYDYYAQEFNVSGAPDESDKATVIESCRFWTERGWTIDDFSNDLRPILQDFGFIPTQGAR